MPIIPNTLSNDVAARVTNTAVRGLIDTALTVGRSAAHALAPDELEYYLCSLELYNSERRRVGFIAFSVMPSDIMESKTNLSNITKTQYGVTDTFSNGFMPRDISVRGTFGKKFRVVQVQKPDGASPVNFFNNVGVLRVSYDDLWGNGEHDWGVPEFHSGYGLTKILKRIVECSYELDKSGRPNFLLFTNHALNTSYVVEVLQDTYSMGQESNTIWNYSLEMRALAPATALVEKSKRENFIVQQGINAAATAVEDVLRALVGQRMRIIF